MSDLQDAIVSTSVKAFNEGYRRGLVDGQQKVMAIVAELAYPDNIGEKVYVTDLNEHLEEAKNGRNAT